MYTVGVVECQEINPLKTDAPPAASRPSRGLATTHRPFLRPSRGGNSTPPAFYSTPKSCGSGTYRILVRTESAAGAGRDADRAFGLRVVGCNDPAPRRPSSRRSESGTGTEIPENEYGLEVVDDEDLYLQRSRRTRRRSRQIWMRRSPASASTCATRRRTTSWRSDSTPSPG